MIPRKLEDALAPVTVIVGHYGAGKTNFTVNLACDIAAAGRTVTVVDLDIVNPYFRASEQRMQLEAAGVRLIAPIFAEFGTSLDVPSLTGQIDPAIRDASADDIVLIDSGGDDVGATALGRFSRTIAMGEHAVLYVANRYRNLVMEPADAMENLREVEAACRLRATALVNNSHLKEATTAETVRAGCAYAGELSALAGLPLVCTCIPKGLDAVVQDAYPVAQLVRNPWE